MSQISDGNDLNEAIEQLLRQTERDRPNRSAAVEEDDLDLAALTHLDGQPPARRREAPARQDSARAEARSSVRDVITEPITEPANRTPDGAHESRPALLSQRFEHALQYAAIVHAGQVRKGTSIPYIAHLLAVAGIALEHGADEDEAIAALLHDAVEDAGGKTRLADIRARFGDRVAGIVGGCTDADVSPKPPWRERKEQHLAHLRGASASVRLIAAADKLHNVRSLLCDHRRLGDALWDRFNGKKDGTLWYYREMVTVLETHGRGQLTEELRRAVEELHRLQGTDA